MKVVSKILLVLIVSFGLVEGACRTFWSEQGTSWALAYRPAIATNYLHLALIQESAEGRRLTPNLQLLAKSPYSKSKSFILRTNSLGTRGPEPDTKRARKRVLFLGDSVTWNDYLAEDETFPAIIQHELSSQVEVINAAVGATGIDNYVMLLNDLGPKLTPDLIIVGLYLNDSTPSLAYKQTKLPSPLEHSRYLRLLFEQVDRFLYLRSAEYQKIVADTLPLGFDIEANYRKFDGAQESECRTHFDKAIAEATLDWGLGWSNLAWEEIRMQLIKIKEWANNNNSQVAVLLFPVSFQLCNGNNLSYPSVKFDQISSQLSLPHLDMLPQLQGQDPQSIYIDHCHFSVEGNKVVAARIAAFLKHAHFFDI